MKRALALILALTMALSLCACGKDNLDDAQEDPVEDVAAVGPGTIYLYGEAHGMQQMVDRELELWQSFYAEGMRDLFIEASYSTAYNLNRWMQADNDYILSSVVSGGEGTPGGVELPRAFYKSIKESCPETVFHGFDVGHGYSTYDFDTLAYLEQSGLKDSEEYQIMDENIRQGEYFYTCDDAPDWVYREEKMAENFNRELQGVNGDVMAITGAGHIKETCTYGADGDYDSMATALKEQYGYTVITEDLSGLRNTPIRKEKMTIGGKEYDAEYFGKASLKGVFEGCDSREFWHIENAYDDFAGNARTGNVLPSSDYLMDIEDRQVYVVKYTMLDGSVRWEYMRTSGFIFMGMLASEEFVVE